MVWPCMPPTGCRISAGGEEVLRTATLELICTIPLMGGEERDADPVDLQPAEGLPDFLP